MSSTAPRKLFVAPSFLIRASKKLKKDEVSDRLQEYLRQINHRLLFTMNEQYKTNIEQPIMPAL